MNQAALLGPFDNALWRLLQDRIPFGVGQDRREPAVSQAREALGQLRGDAVVAEFDQQIVGFSDGVGVGLLQNAFQIFERKMKIAAQHQLQRGPSLLLELVEQSGEVGAVVRVTVVGMRSGDGVGDSVSRRHPAHFDGNLPGFGAVVDLGQKMAVDVDHDVVFSLYLKMQL